jgi:hypothetical protein
VITLYVIHDQAEAMTLGDRATAALGGGKSLWTGRVSKQSKVNHGDRPLEGHGGAGRLTGPGGKAPGLGRLRPGAGTVSRPQQCADRGKL